MIKQIGLPLRGRPILMITRMITDRIGLHSVLLPLLITTNTISSNLVGALTASSFTNRVVIEQCNRTIGCNRTVTLANHITCTVPNPPIREVITKTIATTTLTLPNGPGIFQNGRICNARHSLRRCYFP